ncbi:hypothetical protein PR202_gn00640 [Eleusine coracana subsp. coracana]|uniref:Uncharacterized protein n=1 Tax=Eleusine coracana subsp. coracana TaxID=191504 RepID=A0AAV5G091_ELECO|nr:hypothetical protein PR202_gn00640 [Eleusine coracana subsp. coracana]
MLQVSSFALIRTANTMAPVFKPDREACHKGFLHPWVSALLSSLRNSQPSSVAGALLRPGGQFFLHMQRENSSSAHTFRAEFVLKFLAFEIIEAQ